MKKLNFLLLLLLPLPLLAGIRLPAIFADGMVLQRQSEVSIWGWAAPGSKIFVTGSWNNITDSTATTGGAYWSVKIKTPEAGGPYTLTIKGDNTVTLHDVLIGEVWICSGQSNMEMSENWGELDTKAEGDAANNPDIRLFNVDKATADYPQMDCSGKWVHSNSETLKAFSAVAYFFGKQLQQTLKVPIGLIESCWGGTPAETWTPASSVTAQPDLAAVAQFLQPLPWWPVAPGKAYNAMIAPIVHYGIAGAIWYQGESNVGSYPYTYAKLMQTMITAWRAEWGKVFPFYFVQIAPFVSYPRDGAAILREQQTLCLRIPATGMAVTTDLVDDINNIHPKHKKQVGYRLANWALAETYGQEGIVYKGPSYRSMSIEKKGIRIFFDHAGEKLVCKNAAPAGFQIAGDDEHFVDAQAKIENNTVLVWSDQVKNPVAVRFAFSNAPQPDLFSTNGLPVVPFRTDQWTVSIPGAKK